MADFRRFCPCFLRIILERVQPGEHTCIALTTPDVDNFDCARDYAAWLGLTPKPHSTGGKQKVGRISKMGNRYIRRLLYLG
ncbi:Transposase IS116/IS110/IS902 family protein, partial [Acidocella aminolytica 101 = DSM 11237]